MWHRLPTSNVKKDKIAKIVSAKIMSLKSYSGNKFSRTRERDDGILKMSTKNEQRKHFYLEISLLFEQLDIDALRTQFGNYMLCVHQ